MESLPSAGEPLSLMGPFLQMIFVLVLVLAFAFVVIKFVLPRFIHTRSRGNSNIKLQASFALDIKRTLYIVEVEGKRLLLGGGDQQLNLLCELDNHEKIPD